MKIEKDLYYTKDHEWLKLDGEEALVGLSDHAQEALGDIVYVELPEVDEEFGAEEEFGAVESVKAAADVYMPVGGVVLEVNEELLDAPEMVNETPYEAWMIRIAISDEGELENLMNAAEYETYLESEEEE